MRQHVMFLIDAFVDSECSMPFSRIMTPVQPAELKILQRVFDNICAEHHLPKLGPDAEALALILVRQLQNGVKDERELAALGSGLMHHA